MINDTHVPFHIIDIILRGVNIKCSDVNRVYRLENGNLMVIPNDDKHPIEVPYTNKG